MGTGHCICIYILVKKVVWHIYYFTYICSKYIFILYFNSFAKINFGLLELGGCSVPSSSSFQRPLSSKINQGFWTAAFQHHKVDNQPLGFSRHKVVSIHGNVGISFGDRMSFLTSTSSD